MEKRKKEVYNKVPAVEKIDRDISRLHAEISKLILSENNNAKEIALKNRTAIEKAIEEKAYLLTENGYGVDYLDSIYTCNICKDTGDMGSGERCGCYDQVNNKQGTV